MSTRVFVGTDKEHWKDTYLMENLDTAKVIIKKDWDMLFIYDGNEGSGKSVMAMQDAYYCDPTLTLDRVAFTPEEFKKAVLSADKYQAVIYDEAYTGLSSRATMSMINRTLVTMLAEIRQKNLFVFVVCPCFFDVDKYVALWRSRALIHVRTGEKFQRGFFSFYNVDRKKALFVNGKKYYSYSQPKPNFVGTFPNFYPLDEEEYRKKKKTSLINKQTTIGDAEIDKRYKKIIFNKLVDYPDDTILNKVVKSHIIGITLQGYYKWYNKRGEEEERILK